MKLSNAIIIIAASVMPIGHPVEAYVSQHVASLDSTRLFPGIDFQDDVDAATMGHTPNPAKNLQGRRVGKAFVFPAFIQKLQQATGKTVNVPHGESHDVQTLYITETTDRHFDRFERDLSPLNASDADGSLTAFYVQESTAGAFFDTDDDEMCLPLVEGNVVYFNGGLPHHTVLKSGAVRLVGPFLVSSLEPVGNIDSWNPPTPTGPSGPAAKTPKAPTPSGPTGPIGPIGPIGPAPKAPKSNPIRDRKLKSSGAAFSPMVSVTFASILALGALFF